MKSGTLFENSYKQIGFSKENSYYLMKHQKKNLQLFAIKLTQKIPDLRNAKDHYQSFMRKKNTKSVKQSKIIITQQLKTFENPNIGDIISVLIKHPKISHKLSKTIREPKNVFQVGFNSFLHCDSKKLKMF